MTKTQEAWEADFAELEGRKAYLAGNPKACPFDPNCDPKFYLAWHKGWDFEYDNAWASVSKLG